MGLCNLKPRSPERINFALKQGSACGYQADESRDDEASFEHLNQEWKEEGSVRQFFFLVAKF